MKDCIQEKNLIYVINVTNDLVIRVRGIYLSNVSILFLDILGSYSQHINQRNKYCRPGQVDIDFD
jgi:hypothetical protein